MKPIHRGVIIAATLLSPLSADQAKAAESTSELRIGGIVLPKAPDANVTFESADIAIGPETVVAKYQIVNQSPTPAMILLVFPMPDLDFSDPDASFAIPGSDSVNFVGLSTKIEGKPGGFTFTQSAQLNGKDITPVLRQNKLALVPVGTFQNQLAAIAPEVREKLAGIGVIAQVGNDAQGHPLYFPTWTVRTSGSKRYTFPPGQTVSIEIRYRTSVGVSPDTPLRSPLRGERSLAALVQRYKADFCTDDAFFTGLDKIAAATEANTNNLREQRFVYTMRAQPTPIKDFRLVVDKGRADRVVSFCLDNLKRISPTAFEMRATDFTPDRDLKVLLIGRN